MTVDLEAIRARLAAASPRPWFFNSYSRVDSEALAEVSDDAPDYPSEMRPYSLWQMSKGEQGAPYPSPEDQAWLDQFDAAYHADPEVASVLAHHGDTATGRHRADAELIAHAPDDLEALLALVEARDQEIASLRRIAWEATRAQRERGSVDAYWVNKAGERLEKIGRLVAALQALMKEHAPRCAVNGPRWDGGWECETCGEHQAEHQQPHPCDCGAAEHNAAIDKVLDMEADDRE